jgi:hypothetical protein
VYTVYDLQFGVSCRSYCLSPSWVSRNKLTTRKKRPAAYPVRDGDPSRNGTE